jgi:dCMP deaminase
MSAAGNRTPWDEYWMGFASHAASRSTCPRLSVGAVLVRDRMIVMTGYNGVLAGAPHCTTVGCIIENGHCIASSHAETNAIDQAAKAGISTAYSTLYVTASPCLSCFQAAYRAGIKRIVYRELYGSVDYSRLGLNANSMIPIIKLDIASQDVPAVAAG